MNPSEQARADELAETTLYGPKPGELVEVVEIDPSDPTPRVAVGDRVVVRAAWPTEAVSDPEGAPQTWVMLIVAGDRLSTFCRVKPAT
jgi:hypothetical protein